MATASMLAFISDWSTPAVLFCVLNLMIATIFIASNFKSPEHNTLSQLTRSPSESTENDNSPTQISHPPSLLQRVKSIDFSFSSFHNSVSTADSDQLGNSSTRSLLDRVKSFKLSSPFDSNHKSGYTSSNKDEPSDIDTHDHELAKDNNVTSTVQKNSPVALPNMSVSKLKKSGSAKKVAASEGSEESNARKRPTTEAAVQLHDESVDAKADDFIKRFKQQLKLQRLDSLQRLREMLNRET